MHTFNNLVEQRGGALTASLNAAEKSAAGGGGSSNQKTPLQLVRDGFELAFISILNYE
jgi:hypothetical protein